PAGVGGDGWDVAIVGGADPQAGPGGWDDQGADAGKSLGVGDAAAAEVFVNEGMAGLFAADAGGVGVDVAEACGGGGFGGIGGGFEGGGAGAGHSTAGDARNVPDTDALFCIELQRCFNYFLDCCI